LRPTSPKQRNRLCGFGFLLSSCLLPACFASGQLSVVSGKAGGDEASAAGSGDRSGSPPAADALMKFEGLPVRSISFAGVSRARLASLEGHLAQPVNAPLDREKVASSLRQVYATGLFDSAEVDAERDGDGVALVFRGAPRMFIGVVTVNGAKGATVNTQLQRASRLNSGTRYTKAKMVQAVAQMTLVLAEDGYHEATINYDLQQEPEKQLVNIACQVVSGPQARVGTVTVNGEPGMSQDSFPAMRT